MIRKTIVSILTFTLTWAGVVPAFAVSEGKQPYDNSEISISGSFDAVMNRLYAQIDRSNLDIDELIEKKDFQSQDLVDFVRNSIFFQQYPGLLRGAKGTLISRSGNSLDQAVLLATLLKNNGQEARVLRATLNPAQVKLLIAQISVVKMNRYSTSGKGVVASTEKEGSDRVLYSSATVYRTVNRIVSALKKEGVSINSSSAFSEILKEASDYFWVEYRDGPSQKWVSIHPVFSVNPVEFDNIRPAGVFASEIDWNLQHRVRIQAFIEQKYASRLVTHSIMSAWERPAANLFNKSFSFSTIPSGMPTQISKLDWDKILEKSHFFIPVLNGKAAPDGMAFDLNGDVISLSDIGQDTMGAAGIFKTVGGKTENTSAAIGALGENSKDVDPDNLKTLTALWIEYTVIEPGGKEHTYRRMIMDRLGPAAREKNDFTVLKQKADPRGWVSVTSFLVATGNYSDTFLEEQFLKSVELGNKLTRHFTEDTVLQNSKELKSIAGKKIWTMEQLAYTAAIQGTPQDMATGIYRSSPGVVAIQYLLEKDTITSSVDIITNPRRAFSQNNPVRLAPEKVLAQGIWDTFTEGAALVNSDKFPVPHALFKIESSNKSYTVIQDPRELTEQNWPRDVLFRMEQDLKRGYVLLVADTGQDDTGTGLAWWRVNTQTGESLGIDSLGRGGTASEYIIVMFLSAFLGVIAILGWELGFKPLGLCKKKHPVNMRALECCIGKYRNAKLRNYARSVNVNSWVKAVDSMEAVRLKSCGQLSPKPTRP